MFSSIPWFGGNPWLFLTLWVLLFLSLAAVFARGQGHLFSAGVLRVLGALFYAPFVYLGNATRAICIHAQVRRDDDIRDGEYLSTKLMLVIQVAIIVLAIAMLAGTISTAWFSLLPPEKIRTAVRTASREVVQTRRSLKELEARVSELDASWAGARDAEFVQPRERLQSAIEGADTANARIDKLLQQNEEAQDSWPYQRYQLPSDNTNSSVRYYEDYADRLRRWGARSSFDEAVSVLANQYADNWLSRMKSKKELSGFTEDKVRSREQPTWEDAKDELAGTGRSLSRQETELAHLRESARLRPALFLASLGIGVLWFLIVVWGLGLFLECLWRQIRLASNVSLLAATKRGADTPPESRGTDGVG